MSCASLFFLIRQIVFYCVKTFLFFFLLCPMLITYFGILCIWYFWNPWLLFGLCSNAKNLISNSKPTKNHSNNLKLLTLFHQRIPSRNVNKSSICCAQGYQVLEAIGNQQTNSCFIYLDRCLNKCPVQWYEVHDIAVILVEGLCDVPS